jgi:hypothetical protein
MSGNEVKGSVEIGAKRNERNAETEWTRVNEATECTLAIKTTYALFFTAPLKRVVGVRGFGGCGSARNTASILSKWLWYWILNIMFL